MPRTAFWTLWQKLQIAVTAKGRGLLSPAFKQGKGKGKPAALGHQHTPLKPKQIQGGCWLCTRLRFWNRVLTNPWLRIQDRQSDLWPDPVWKWGAQGSLSLSRVAALYWGSGPLGFPGLGTIHPLSPLPPTLSASTPDYLGWSTHLPSLPITLLLDQRAWTSVTNQQPRDRLDNRGKRHGKEPGAFLINHKTQGHSAERGISTGIYLQKQNPLLSCLGRELWFPLPRLLQIRCRTALRADLCQSSSHTSHTLCSAPPANTAAALVSHSRAAGSQPHALPNSPLNAQLTPREESRRSWATPEPRSLQDTSQISHCQPGDKVLEGASSCTATWDAG